MIFNFHLYKCNINQTLPSTDGFFGLLKAEETMELIIAERRACPQRNQQKWNKIRTIIPL